MLIRCKYCGEYMHINARLNKSRNNIQEYHIDCFIKDQMRKQGVINEDV